jgi:Npun R1517
MALVQTTLVQTALVQTILYIGNQARKDIMQQSQVRTLRSVPSQLNNVAVSKVAPKVGVYECEVNLKFRMIEEGQLPTDREELLEMLLEAFGYGGDEYLEALDVTVTASAVTDVEASPQMRRQLIRLRNSKDLA